MASLILPKSVQASKNGILVQVAVEPPLPLDVARLKAFNDLIGGPNESVPLLYPIAECFRLIIQAMVLPAFPCYILGAVLGKSRSVLLRPLNPTDKLAWKCKVNSNGIRKTIKGDTEIDVTTSASDSDGCVVWRSVVTVIVLGKNRSKAAAKSKQSHLEEEALASGEEIDVWKLDQRIGRQFGLINGDLNPIHIHWLLSNLFRFKRPIAHALFLCSKAEASIRRCGVKPSYPCIMETEFKRPTLLPAKLSMVIEQREGQEGQTRSSDAEYWMRRSESETGLSWNVMTAGSAAGPQKCVIIGKLWQGKGASGKAA